MRFFDWKVHLIKMLAITNFLTIDENRPIVVKKSYSRIYWYNPIQIRTATFYWRDDSHGVGKVFKCDFCVESALDGYRPIMLLLEMVNTLMNLCVPTPTVVPTHVSSWCVSCHHFIFTNFIVVQVKLCCHLAVSGVTD